MDTVGSLVDKLATINSKLFLGQELIYTIRRMSFAQFHERFILTAGGAKELYDGLQKLSDLNIQRTSLVNEVDSTLVALIQAAVRGEELDNGSNIQRAHKTIGVGG